MLTNRPLFAPRLVKVVTRALILPVTLLVAACSNDPNPPPLREKREDGSPWRVQYRAMPEDVRSLDPQIGYDQMSHIVLETVYDTLLQYAPMKTDPYEVEPCLLERMPERVNNPDGTVTYNCQLKRGIMFQDDPCFPGGKGRELIAEDVHFAWQRMADPKVECPVLATLQEFIIGMREANEAATKNGGVFDYSKPLRGIEVVDRYNFRINLTRPYPQLRYWMAMQFTTPVPREAVEYYDGKTHPDGPGGRTVTRPQFKWHPVSTGPFRIVEYIPGSRFRFIRNENYRTTTFPTGGWPEEKDAVNHPLAGKALPLVDEVQLGIFREQLPMWLLTRQGFLDRVGVGKDAFNSVVTPTHDLTPKYRDRGMRMEKDVELSTFWIQINMQDPVLGPNKKLRQALSCAFDAKTWVDIFYNGVPNVATQLVPPGIFGYQRDFKNPYTFNIEKAHQLMKEAGYPNGIDPKTGRPLQLTIDASGGGSWERQSVEYEQRCLERLGIKVQVIENTFARQTEKLDDGNFQLASAGWGADYPDPENFFFLFYSKNLPPTGPNHSRFSYPEFDQLYEQMAQMDNTPERLAIVHKMNAFLAEECPVIFNFNKAYFSIVQPWAPRTNNNMMWESGLKFAVADPVLRTQKQREWNAQPKWPIAAALLGLVAMVGYAVRWNKKHNV
ncbi:ABC transporter substrate-binding protein [Verrucomicrobiota bacterium sgz303538]